MLQRHATPTSGTPEMCLRAGTTPQPEKLALPFLSGRAKPGLKPVRRGPGLPYQDCAEPRKTLPWTHGRGLQHWVHSLV